jgi:adenosylcobinamide-GDP ribazoletransferase
VRGGTGRAAVRTSICAWTDPLRLVLGTLTVLPTPPPTRVDRRVGSWAMTLAPLAGLLLAAAGVALLSALGRAGVAGAGPPTSATLAAVLTVGLLALLTRAMHLDGLADTVDGLGSRRPAPEALEIMRRGDVGPFGVVTLLMVVLLQVLALGRLMEGGLGAASLVLALAVSRLALPLLCLQGVRAARADGLGSPVVGSVAPWQAVVSLLLTAVVLLPLLLLAGLGPDGVPLPLPTAAVAGALGLGVAALLAWRAVRRLGGLTGDVLGAAVEATFTTVLVVLALCA